MAGEIFFQVTAAEVREIRKDPKIIRKFKKGKRDCLDLEHVGYNLDLALDYMMDELGEPSLAVAVSGEKDVGDNDVPARLLSAKKVREAAAALSKISKDDFKSAFQLAHGGCEEEVDEMCYKYFEDLVKFYEDAAKKGRAVVKTIY